MSLDSVKNRELFLEQGELLIREFLDSSDLSEKSKETYQYALKQFFAFLADQDYPEVTKKVLIEYKKSIDHMSALSVKNYLSALRGFLRFVDSCMGMTKYSAYMTEIKAPRSTSFHKRDPLTSNQISEVLNSIDTRTLKGKRDYAIILLAATTGIRPVSISEAQVKDLGVYFDEPVIRVKQKGYHDKDHIIKLGPSTEKAIRDYLSERADENYSDSDALFASTSNNNYGQKMSAKAISRMIRNHLDQNGFKGNSHITPYSLRHSAATLSLMTSDADLENLEASLNALLNLQQVMGHESMNTSLIYLKGINRRNNDTEIKIDKLISEKLN